MKKSVLITFLILFAMGCASQTHDKYLIILQAGTESHEGLARALHALLYTTELKQNGFDVVLVFDGAGTEWAEELRDPEYKLHSAYLKLKEQGVTEIICDYCAMAFQVHEPLKEGDVPLVAEFEGHPSLVNWIRQGYTPLVL